MLLYFNFFFLFSSLSLSLSSGLKGRLELKSCGLQGSTAGQHCLMGQLVESWAHVSFAVFIFILHRVQRLIDGILFFFLNIAFWRPRACLSQPHWTYVHIFPWAVFKCVHPCGCICLVCAPTDLMGPFPWPIASLSLPLAAVRRERL